METIIVTFAEALRARHSLLDDGKLRRRGVIKKVSTVQRPPEEKKFRSVSLNGHAKIVAKLPFCRRESSGRVEKRRGARKEGKTGWKKEGERRKKRRRKNEIVSGGKRKKKPENRLHSRKGLSTFSHDTICCRHLTDNASAGAKYVFQLCLLLFPFRSFSSFLSRSFSPVTASFYVHGNCQTIRGIPRCTTMQLPVP